MDFYETWLAIVAYFETNGWHIVIFMAVLVAGVLIVRALCFGIRKILLKGKIEKTLVGFIITLLRFTLYLVLIFILASILKLDMTPIATAISAAVVAIGLALQGSLSNLANGVLVIANRPFKEGDYVDIGSTSGTVKSIGMFVTELITPDNKKIILTNTTVINGPIVNYSSRAERRIDLVMSVSYSSDADKVKQVLEKVVTKHPSVLADPAPNIRLHAFKESSIDFIVRVWVKTEDYWDVYWDLNEAIFAAFKKNNIEIPFNQLDVHVTKEDK